MLYLAHWARKLSWQETACSFHTSWEKVSQAVEWVVEWGLAHRTLGPIRAFGVDEIQCGRGHQYLTLVYQIEAGCIRFLWVGKEPTTESFEKFFALIGAEIATKVCRACGPICSRRNSSRSGNTIRQSGSASSSADGAPKSCARASSP
jgi:hypothetical protein